MSTSPVLFLLLSPLVCLIPRLTLFVSLSLSDRMLTLVDYQRGSAQYFEGHCDLVSSVAFSAQSDRIISGSYAEILCFAVE